MNYKIPLILLLTFLFACEQRYTNLEYNSNFENFSNKYLSRKNFHNIKLNSLTNNMLSFWEKDFEKAIKKHIKFLKENLESQTKYSSK